MGCFKFQKYGIVILIYLIIFIAQHCGVGFLRMGCMENLIMNIFWSILQEIDCIDSPKTIIYVLRQ